jgi:hypothetical protein
VEGSDPKVKADYVDYLRQYRKALAETDVDRLEEEWRILDEKWMRIRYWSALCRQTPTWPLKATSTCSGLLPCSMSCFGNVIVGS